MQKSDSTASPSHVIITSHIVSAHSIFLLHCAEPHKVVMPEAYNSIKNCEVIEFIAKEGASNTSQWTWAHEKCVGGICSLAWPSQHEQHCLSMVGSYWKMTHRQVTQWKSPLTKRAGKWKTWLWTITVQCYRPVFNVHHKRKSKTGEVKETSRGFVFLPFPVSGSFLWRVFLSWVLGDEKWDMDLPLGSWERKSNHGMKIWYSCHPETSRQHLQEWLWQ